MASLIAASPARPAPPAVVGSPALVRQTALGFGLFLVVNATLFVRPAEVLPALVGWEIYQYVILLCLAVSFPAVLAQVSPAALEARPTTVCVLALLGSVVLALLFNGFFGEAIQQGFNFFKIVVYYLLFTALVITPGRLRALLLGLGSFSAVATLLTLLDYRGIITLPRILPPGAVPIQIDAQEAARLVGTGIFWDPNDFCLLMVLSLVLGLYGLTDRRAGSLRWLWLGPLALFAYAFTLTGSRGGLIALMAGMSLLCSRRIGWARTLALGALGLPVLLLLLSGRQTNISANVNTGQSRIQLWSDGLMLARQHPLFGVGMHQYMMHAGQVAHNSYLHCFAELGLCGGMFFLGAMFLSLRGLYRLGTAGRQILDPDLRRAYPFVVGVVGAYATGMMTLTLCYEVPTYTILALAGAFLAQARAAPDAPAPRFDLPLLARFAAVSVCFLVGMHVFVRLFFHA